MSLNQEEFTDTASLASTAESEQASEYLVEDICAERHVLAIEDPDDPDDEGGYETQYLVKWAGYPADRCSWEPKEQFDNEETLRNWEAKKQQIAEGKKPRFSVKKWEKQCLEVEKQTKARKQKRRRKREQRAQQKAKPQADPDGANPVPADQPKASSSTSHLTLRRPSPDSVGSPNLFVPKETPPPSSVASRNPKEVHSREPSVLFVPNKTPSESPQPKTTGKPTTGKPTKSNVERNLSESAREPSRSRLGQVAADISRRTKPSTFKQPPPPKTTTVAKPVLSEFAVRERKDAYQHRWSEKAMPVPAAMELMTPSEYTARAKLSSNNPAAPQSVSSPTSCDIDAQIANELQTTLAGLSDPSPDETSTAVTQHPAGSIANAPLPSMPPPANPPRATLASSSAHSVPPRLNIKTDNFVNPRDPTSPVCATSASSDVTPALAATAAIPTGPRAMDKARNTAGVRSVLASRDVARFGPFRLETPEPSLDKYRSPLQSRQPSLARQSPPRRRSRSRPRSPYRRWSPPGRPSVTRRSRSRSPPSYRRRSPLRRSPSPRRSRSQSRSRYRRLSPSRRGSRFRRSSSGSRSPRRRRPSPRPSSRSRRPSPSWQSRSSKPSSPTRGSSPSHRRSPERFPPRDSSSFSLSRGKDSWRPSSPAANPARLIASESSRLAHSKDTPLANDQPIRPTESQRVTSNQPDTSLQPLKPALGRSRLARMPVRPRPERVGRGTPFVTAGGCWWDKSQDELLVHVFFGPDKKFIGPLRLCGISRQIGKDLMHEGKTGKVFEVWFQHVCTAEEFQKLSTPNPDNIKATGWFEAFEDNGLKLFDMSQVLQKTDLIAIHYPVNPGPWAHSLIAWSHGSPSFVFPKMSRKDLPTDVETPLLVAAHTMLPSIEALRSRTSQRSHAQTLQQPSLDVTHPLRTGSSGMDSQTRNDRSTRRSSSQINPTESRSLQSPEPHSPAPANDPQMSAGLSDQPTFVNPHAVAELPTTMLSGFMKQKNINAEELATIEDGGKTSQAFFFYLHFPPDDANTKNELELVKLYLASHGMTVLTNLEPNGWAKFHQSSKMGVIIFHESFSDYASLDPPLKLVLHNSLFNFWVMRLNNPLQFMDDRYCSPSDHCARIFPKHGIILLTEDMLNDLKGTALILQWLRATIISKSSTRYHIMLPPMILEWIDKRSDDESFSQDHGLLGVIRTLIMKLNVTDVRKELFKESSLDPSSSSAVVSHPVYGYGTRTEHDEPKLKDKGVRDADHLIEHFAGWALLNRQRFRHFLAITSLSKTSAPPRWSSWGHITVICGGRAGFFTRFKLRDQEIEGYWRHLCGGDSTSKSGPSQASTPGTARTPRTPMWPNKPASTHAQSSPVNHPPQGSNNYPAPYQ